MVNGHFSNGDHTGWTLSYDSDEDHVTSGQLSGSSFRQRSRQTCLPSFLVGGDGATPNALPPHWAATRW